MRVLIAPDAFKGALTAREAAAAVARGLPEDWDVDLCPLSDGGEGFLDVFEDAEHHLVPTEDAYGAPIRAAYGLGDGFAAIEVARVIGLYLNRARDPLRASTGGLAPLVSAAVAPGRTTFIGLGGSATVDGGLGLLRGLGGAFFDAHGREVTSPAALVDVVRADVSPSFDGDVVALVDVDQRLLGAAEVFGPQKGADTAAVSRLERGLLRWAEVLDPDGRHRDVPGAGAAGGLGFALSCLGARLVPGAEAILERVAFLGRARRAGLVFTGEGRFDAQTAQGKLVAAVAAEARRANTPCIALAGEVAGAAASVPGLDAVFSLAPGPCRRGDAMAATAERLAQVAAAVAATWNAAARSPGGDGGLGSSAIGRL
ncbi:MAG: glycerate kinase [Myxococcota bacterium]